MTTKRVTVHAAKTQLSRLIQAACRGQEVVIARRDVAVARLVPVRQKPVRRRFGAMKGRAKVTAAFFEPLPSDELAGWGS
jgi:antitoxin (DNA-binding transcriptional repressor) of toxin-antitoxin stability system